MVGVTKAKLNSDINYYTNTYLIFYVLYIYIYIFLFVTVNISLSTDAKIETHQRLTSNKARPKSLRPFGARLKSVTKPMQHFQSIKRTGKSEQSSISLPIQLGTPGGMKKPK